ncbi:PAS domain S-box protein [Cupriavidus taiwanensis]|uniref:PAS domain S-box protein n=1 Tax=Cupriavidus taiwanensis TaxID=164546 RepID=UPI0039C20C0A
MNLQGIANQPCPAPNLAPAPDFEGLIEAAGDLIYTLDLEGRFTFFNQAVERVLGYTPSELLGEPFVRILTPESAQVASRHYGQGLAGKENTPFFEVEARRRDGTIVYLEVRAGSLIREGVLVGRQGIARDINELKSLQSAVADKLQRMTLLEERTRIAMSMYTRIAALIYEDPGQGLAGDEALREVQSTITRVTAEKHGLTAFDLKLLGMLAKGLSNEEIAREACRSPHTIKDHMKRIMLRLGAKRRAEAVACALRLGLLDFEP